MQESLPNLGCEVWLMGIHTYKLHPVIVGIEKYTEKGNLERKECRSDTGFNFL